MGHGTSAWGICIGHGTSACSTPPAQAVQLLTASDSQLHKHPKGEYLSCLTVATGCSRGPAMQLKQQCPGQDALAGPGLRKCEPTSEKTSAKPWPCTVGPVSGCSEVYCARRSAAALSVLGLGRSSSMPSISVAAPATPCNLTVSA